MASDIIALENLAGFKIGLAVSESNGFFITHS
jgi:hypothetical protein